MTTNSHEDDTGNRAVLKSMRGSPASTRPIRAQQMETLRLALEGSPISRTPLLVVGDFNFPDERLALLSTEG